MNRIYKVIYSKARQCAIVVSELAKSSHKNSRKGASHTGTPALARILAAALVVGAVTWGGVPEVSWAADNTTVTDNNGNEVTNTDSKKDINANATVDGGVALGSDSVASTEAGKTGYDALGKKHNNSDTDYSAWVSTDAAVSVGGADREVEYDVLDKDGKPVIDKTTGKTKQEKQIVKSTRQITNLAAGTEDTDAVNVAQMKAAADAVKTHFYSVNSQDTKAGNYNNDGATGTDALAAGVGANTNIDNSIAMGTNAQTLHSGGTKDTTQMGTGDIAIGDNAHTNNYIDQGGSIAIGQNAFAENMTGVQESSFAFGQTKYNPVYKSDYYWGVVPYAYLPENPSKVPGGLAIGQNTYVRTGGLMVGTHNYKGKLGDVEVDSADTGKNAKSVFTTTLGTNSFNSGAFSTITGAYSIASSDYAGGNSTSTAGKNFGATIMGSLNSIESSTASSEYSGVANSIVGTANRTFNSNGSLIFGAGNEITNSVTTISAPSDGGDSAQALQKTLMQKVKASNGGGAALAIGGGNKIDGSIRSQVIGVNNKLTGNTYHKDGYWDWDGQYHPTVDGGSSQYNMIDGYNNTAQNVNHAYVIGANNTIQGKNFSDSDKIKDGTLNDAGWEKAQKDDNLIVIGDNHTLSNDVSNNIILGTADKTLTTSASNIVMIGHNADAQKEGGVALGADSVAAIDKGQVGYDPANGDHQNDTTGTWKSTAAAVSVGDASKNITRQITNVAAGFNATDAVNVAQLKNVENQVTSNTQNINYLNGRVGELGDRINKVGAGAAALAALHPLDYDPEDKWDFAAGVGNYRNATAAAVGLFYRPNERTMFNLGWTMGDNRNMVNGGFSLKFGKSNKYIKYSKAEMASVIDKQSREIAELKARDVQNAKDKAEMKADNAEMKAEIEALKKQVEALAAKK